MSFHVVDYAPEWRNDEGLIANKKALADALAKLTAMGRDFR